MREQRFDYRKDISFLYCRLQKRHQCSMNLVQGSEKQFKHFQSRDLCEQGAQEVRQHSRQNINNARELRCKKNPATLKWDHVAVPDFVLVNFKL